MASVGMVRLMRIDDFFTSVSQPIAQVLVSLDNLMDRRGTSMRSAPSSPS